MRRILSSTSRSAALLVRSPNATARIAVVARSWKHSNAEATATEHHHKDVPLNDQMGPMSFIEKAKIGDGKVVCRLHVTKELSNAYNTLHGGAITTLIDVVGTLALIAVDPEKAGVSVEMNTTFVSSAKVGTTVIAEGHCLKAGKRLGFTDVVIRDEKTGNVVATGRHTKAL